MDSINDKCWAMVDAVKLGDFFDKYNLPPILFPLVILLIALLVFWLVFRPGGATPCGDSQCLLPETCRSCPIDCGECSLNRSAGMIVTVELIGLVTEPVKVTLFDKDNSEIDSLTAMTSMFEFPGVEPQMMGAIVYCPNGKQRSSRPDQVDSANNVISLTLPEGCFEYIRDVNNEPLITHGNVVVSVSVLEAATGEPVDGVTITAVRSSDDLPEGTGSTESGEATLNLRSDDFYYLTAGKEGYMSYNGKSQRFYLLPGDTVYKTIELEAIEGYDPSSPATSTGRLRVCAKSGSTPIASGRVSVMELGGSELDYAYLTPQDAGCLIFSIAAGKTVRATLVSPPAGCISPGFSTASMILPGQQKSADLSVTCGQGVAYVKVIVHDRTGRVLTDQSKITLWDAVRREQIPGTAPDSSLSMGSGGYTEEVSIPAATLIQAKAAGVPLGYVDTPSGPGAFRDGEHGSIDIVLGEKSRGEFAFLGASIVYTPATPGSPVQVFVQQIMFNQTVLTPENSQVVMIIDGKEYNATYMNAGA